jgi:hypothetical protein
MAAVNVLASANTVLYTPTGTNMERIAVFNNGPNTIWVDSSGNASGDLRSTGFPIPAAGSATFDPLQGALVARASTADQAADANTRVIRVSVTR